MDILVRIEDEICVVSGTITKKPLRDMYFINEQKAHIQYIDLYDLHNNVTLPVDYADMKYKYNTTDEFYLNEDYEEPIYLEKYVRDNRDRIKNLESADQAAISRVTTLEGQMATAISVIQDLQSRVTTLEGT